jgi:hypothetical protein
VFVYGCVAEFIRDYRFSHVTLREYVDALAFYGRYGFEREKLTLIKEYGDSDSVWFGFGFFFCFLFFVVVVVVVVFFFFGFLCCFFVSFGVGIGLDFFSLLRFNVLMAAEWRVSLLNLIFWFTFNVTDSLLHRSIGLATIAYSFQVS